VIQGYKDFVSYGLHLNLADRIGLHTAELTATYSPNRYLENDERLHAAFNYHYWQWSIDAAYNKSDFYDLFGPTKTSRKGYSLSINYTDVIINDKPASLDYSLTLSGYGGLERLPDYQNVNTSFDKFGVASGSLRYKYLLRTIGAVDVEKGLQWNLSTSTTVVREKGFPKIHMNTDYGFLLPVDHSSLWLRTSIGYSPGDRNDPFANFYFGGFGNNWVDYQEVKRYRSYYSFPGVELNQLGGTNFGKLMLELTTPAIRFKRFGIPNFYCTWAHVTFFSSGLILEIDNAPTQRKVLNIGSQIDFKFVLFTSLESTLSAGYAAAFEKTYAPQTEFMISLKIL
jgi:hypothetical protein